MYSVVSKGKQDNYAGTIQMLEKKNYQPVGFLRPSTCRHQNRYLPFHQPKTVVHKWGKIWHIWNFPQYPLNHQYMLQSTRVYRQNVIQDVYRQEPFQKAGHCHCLMRQHD